MAVDKNTAYKTKYRARQTTSKNSEGDLRCPRYSSKLIKYKLISLVQNGCIRCDVQVFRIIQWLMIRVFVY